MPNENENEAESRGLTRRLARWLVKRYYPNLKITGAEQIPQTGPVLLCANHANSLLDPVLIGIATGRPVRFLAKAPLFDNPLLGPIMRALGMIPAFRGSDDTREVRRNIESLDVGAKVLIAGHAMGIFPEGKSTDQAHLEMVRSGAARMALQAAVALRTSEDGTKRLLVVPIGISYERKDEFRSSAWIQVAKPIDVDECLEQHEGNVRKARRALTDQLGARLKEVVVHLDDPQWEPWLDDLQTLARAPRTPGKAAVPPLERRKRIADAMNYFLANDQQQTESVADEIKAYHEQVQLAGLCIDSPVLRMHGLKVCAELLWSLFCLIVLLIPALVGTLHHLVPFVLVRKVAAKMDQPGRKTISTNRMLVGVPLYLGWYVLVAIWMFGYFSAWFAWTWLIAAPFCGVIASHYWRRAGRTAQLLWHQLRATVRRNTLKQLRQQEADLRERLKEMEAQYIKLSPQTEIELQPSFKKQRLVRMIARILVVLLIAAVAWVGSYRFFDKPISGNGLDLKKMPPQRIEAFLNADEKVVVHLFDGLDKLETDAVEMLHQFEVGERSFTKQADYDDVQELLRRYVTYRQALLRVIWKYQRYADIDQEALRLRAFLLDFTAAATLYQASLKFVQLFDDSPQAVAKLNEPVAMTRAAGRGGEIPAGFYDTIRRNLASPQNIKMFELARQYYHQEHVQDLFRNHQLSEAEPYDRFHREIADAEQTIRQLDDSMSERIIDIAVSDLGRLFYEVQYETQSTVSTWIGDFKIRQPHMGKSLIEKDQLAKLSDLLQPGDILLERRNWYLSNAFLPGYWPHGAVYVGTAEDLRQRGLDQNETIRQKWEEFITKDHAGHEHVIIEAVSEGVVFSSLEHSIGGADSVAVLRPNVSEEERNTAISLAFSLVGLPYDFEFDFESADMLVCTEVVYRTYGGNSGPIDFPLEEIMGRQTMPAINLVEKFNTEYGSDEAQFEFIAFIDGDEETETAQFKDSKEFRKTLDRSASTFLQGSNPIDPLGWVLLSMTVLCGIAVLVTPLTRRIRS